MKVLRNTIVLAILALLIGSLLTEVKAQNVPTTAVPAGFGRYCSVSYPGGGWALLNYSDANSDPCKELLKPGSNGKIERAGLWAVNKENNVLRVCDGDLGIYRQVGSGVIKLAFDEASGKKHCVFTVAPTAMPVFSKPYRVIFPVVETQVKTANARDFNPYDVLLSPTLFGQQVNPKCPDSQFIDRSGKQNCGINGHSAYDWAMPSGTQLRAVASGIVREARWRDVKSFANGDAENNCYKKSPQGEIYVEHQIGTGEYAERFIVYYAHVSKLNVKTGDKVTSGQLLGSSGDTGCSSGPHLHFGVFRTTNLSGFRALDLTYPDTGYGVSAIQGQIDPFGWNAPQQIDPWAYKFLGDHKDPYLGTVPNPGAFSINLWLAGENPPSN